MIRPIDEIKGYLAGVVEYFKANIENDKSFEPEYKIGSKILRQIEKAASVDEIISTTNSMNKTQHYNGSGWYDFQNQLCRYFESIGVDVEIVGEEQAKFLKRRNA